MEIDKERREGFKDLRQNAEMYRALYESANDAIFLMKKGVFVDCNPRTLEMFRGTKADIIGKVPYKELSPEIQPDGSLSRDKAIEMINSAISGGTRVFEWQHRRLDGSLFYTQVSLNLLNFGRGDYIQAIVRDITEWKQTKDALQVSEERYRHLFNNTPLGVYRTTPDGRFLMANPALLKMLGFSDLDELMTQNIEESATIVGYPRDKFKEDLEKYGRVDGLEIAWRRKDESVLWVRESAVAIRNKDDKTLYYDGVIEDITESKRAEQRLAESEKKYRTLVEQSNCMIYIFRHDKLFFVNNTACETLGYTRQEIYDMPLWDLVYQDDLSMMKELAHTRPKDSNPIIARVVKKSGEVIDCQFSGGPVVFNNKKAVMGIARDITDIRRLEKEVQKIDRLESLGLLAGGIAHDFNNLLTGVMGHISLAKTRVYDDDELKNILEEAENASIMAKRLTQQLLTFSSGGAPIKESMDIKAIIEESTRFILRGSNVKSEFDFGLEISMVDADREQLSQVISNLVINAVQAMPDGGLIRIKARNINVYEDNSHSLNAGKYVYIEVADTGTGIPETMINKIFDPYFSTKEDGSGIGLAVSFSIVRRHNGMMEVSSTLGKGSVFKIYLPSVQSVPIKTKQPDQNVKLLRERILLMDDKAVIQRVASVMLKNLGYTVDTAMDGNQAVDMYRNAFHADDPYVCVILDLLVPKGMGGKEAVAKILDIDPNAVAIVSSGYSDDPIMANYKEYGFKGVIAKPYMIDGLARALRRARMSD